MRSLNLDTGTKTGWCRMEDDGSFSGGTWDYSKEKNFDRCIYLANDIAKILHSELVTHVTYEAVWHHQSPNDSDMYGSLKMAVLRMCSCFQVPCFAVPWPTIKKFAGGGRFKKEDMIRAAVTRWPGVRFVDDNHVDATFMGAWLHSEEGKQWIQKPPKKQSRKGKTKLKSNAKAAASK